MLGLNDPNRPESIRSLRLEEETNLPRDHREDHQGWIPLVEKFVQGSEGNGQVPSGDRPGQIENGSSFVRPMTASTSAASMTAFSPA